MGRFNKRAKMVVAGSVVLATVGGGVAFAYWSSTGSGTGTGSTSTGASSLVVAQTSAPTDLAPGVAPEAITGTITNKAANSALVNSVTVSISGVTPAANASGTCDATDYTLTNPTVALNKDVASGATISFSGPTLGFNDKSGTNQDGCKGATVNLSYSTN